MSPGSWMVDWATMVGSGGQESFLCRHCWSTALTFVKGALQSLRQLHWALATGCQSCGKKSQSFYYLQHLPAKNPRRIASHHWLEEGAIDTWLHRLSPKRPWHETLGFMVAWDSGFYEGKHLRGRTFYLGWGFYLPFSLVLWGQKS